MQLIRPHHHVLLSHAMCSSETTHTMHTLECWHVFPEHLQSCTLRQPVSRAALKLYARLHHVQQLYLQLMRVSCAVCVMNKLPEAPTHGCLTWQVRPASVIVVA